MKPVPNAIRTEAPSYINIAKGIFKLAHLRQFFVVIISISFIITVLRIISFKKFLVICSVAGTFIFILYFAEKYIKSSNDNKYFDKEQYTPLDSGSQWSYPTAESAKYETTTFFSKDFPGEQNVCGICLEPIREGSQVVVFQCLHFFHPECAAKWTKIRRVCPTCKASIE